MENVADNLEVYAASIFRKKNDEQVNVSKTMHEGLDVGAPFGILVTLDWETSARIQIAILRTMERTATLYTGHF
jgi:hypothetical protein